MNRLPARRTRAGAGGAVAAAAAARARGSFDTGIAEIGGGRSPLMRGGGVGRFSESDM